MRKLFTFVDCGGSACNNRDVVRLIDHAFRGSAEPCRFGDVSQ